MDKEPKDRLHLKCAWCDYLIHRDRDEKHYVTVSEGCKGYICAGCYRRLRGSYNPNKDRRGDSNYVGPRRCGI